MTLVRHLDRRHRGVARRHGRDRCARQQVGIAAANHQERHARHGVELSPQRGRGFFDVDPVQNLGELAVVVGNDSTLGIFERTARKGDPLVVGQLGELRAEQPPQDVRRLMQARHPRQLADIALDSHQPLRVDDRADIVEDAAGERRRPHRRKQHGQDPAARRADEHGAGDPERSQHRQHVGQLDLDVVVLRIAVVVGPAAAAGVEGDGAPRRRRVVRERGRERLEVGAGARQPRQAHRRQPRGGARAPFTHEEPQPVRRGDETACGFRAHVRELMSSLGVCQRDRLRA